MVDELRLKLTNIPTNVPNAEIHREPMISLTQVY
jgi:hypothetical protein